MAWKGLHPIVELTRAAYQKGVILTKPATREVETRLVRNPQLPKWGILIRPYCSVRKKPEITLTPAITNNPALPGMPELLAAASRRALPAGGSTDGAEAARTEWWGSAALRAEMSKDAYLAYCHARAEVMWSSESGHPVKPHRPVGRFSRTHLDSGSPGTNAVAECCRTS